VKYIMVQVIRPHPLTSILSLKGEEAPPKSLDFLSLLLGEKVRMRAKSP